MEIPDILALKIVDIVNASSPSVRLSNCINEAAKKKALPFETVGEFIEVRGEAREKLLALKNLGRKTAGEFIEIVEKALPGEIPGASQGDKTENIDPDILSLKIVDIVNASSSSVRLSNCINEAAKKKALPFETVQEFLDAQDNTVRQIQSIANLGKKTAEELIAILDKALSDKLPTPIERKKRIDDPEVRNLRVVDLVNKAVASEQLSRRIHLAVNENELPFETVGEILDAGEEARSTIAKTKNLTRGATDELLKLVKLYVSGNLPEAPRHEKRIDLVKSLAGEYPGVFDPLLEDYTVTRVENRIKLEFLEDKIRALASDKTHHAEMAWLSFSGQTLETIGKKYGLTRERVRQILKKYENCITDVDSKIWAEKSIQHLITRIGNGKRLPENEEIDRHHPKLSRALIKHFADNQKGYGLNPVRRLEIARKLELDLAPEFIVQKTWSLERVIYEVQEFAKALGKPDLMPMQKEMADRGRQDLRGAVGKFGGQSKVAELAGLAYQGQIVSPDGSRTYWTDERIKEFLCDVAREEGHPDVMPTMAECKKHAPNPATIGSILTRSSNPSPEKPSRNWFEVSQLCGLKYVKGVHRITLPFVKSFVKSLGDALYSLSPSEIYVLFEQQGIAKTGENLHRSRSFDNLIEAVQSGFLPKDEVERWLGDEKGELVETLLDPEISSVEEAFQVAGKKPQKTDHKKKADNPSDESYSEDVERQVPIPTAGDSLDALRVATDALVHASSDEEAVKFLIAKAADKLWKRCFYNEEAALSEAKNHHGNTYSEAARDAFINEYTRCTRLPIPEGYSFTDATGTPRQPKLMQRLIAYRTLTQGQVLNLSGTGTGKTLSAILASRMIGARLTLVSCPNTTVEPWKNAILNTFPQSEVITKPRTWQPTWRSSDLPRYVVVNHEMFQDRYEGAIKNFIQTHPLDLVVIDELHQVKQRELEKETQRRRLMTGLITDIPENRARPRVLGMSATPIINNLQEGKSLVELVTSVRHDEIGGRASAQNCMRLYQRFTTLGFRMMPKRERSREPQIHPIDATPYLGELLDLGTHPHPQQVEAVLVKARWPVILHKLQKKTVVFTEYVKDIVPYLREGVLQAGFSVGIFTGEEKLATAEGYRDSLQQFLKGETEVLVASIRTLGTGVDELQYVCNNVIFATLPWTSTDYEQAIGRFDREGFAFDRLDIHVPKTYAILSSGQEWSWCESRLLRLENKRDIARAAVDGEIPDTEGQLTPTKATQYWMGWLRRLSEEGLQEIRRREIRVPLDESNQDDTRRRRSSYGDFANLNARWNKARSSVTHERLTDNPEEWCYYHTRMLEREKTWQVNPRLESIRHLKENLPKDAIVGDFGCGQGQLSEELKDIHTVHSFDHVAIRPDIVSCDMANTPLEESALDAAVFSLSLMGSNLADYIKEAYRTLKLGGQLLVWHPAEHHDRNRFVESLKEFGFAIIEEGQIYKWHRIWAIKQARKAEPPDTIRF